MHFILFIKSCVYSLGKILTAVLKLYSIFQELQANSVLLKKFTILDKGLRQLIHSGTKSLRAYKTVIVTEKKVGSPELIK